jgi:O-antigen/teichoic acid export membrane protein
MNDSGSDQLAGLTRGGLLARNTVFNLLGQGIPLLVAIFAVPFLIRRLGTDRFGVLTLVWMVMGYFNLFDLGLGRALTQMVSSKLGAGQHEEIPAAIWTALLMTLFMGLMAGVVLGLLGPWLVRGVLNIPMILQADTLNVFYLMAFSVPPMISAASLRGILEAHQRFDLLSAVGGVMGSYSFLAPVLVLSFSRQLTSVVGVLLAGRLISWGATFLLCLHVVPSLRRGIIFKRSLLRPLIGFGGWMTVSNIIGPLMAYLDRFLIGGLVSIAAVAYYATPYDLVTKLWLIPGALTGVLFAAMSASFIEDQPRAARLFHQGVKYIFLVMFPLTLVFVTLAHDGLNFWLGAEFAANGTRVLQWLAIGVFINSLAWIPYALVQGAGRPDLSAKLFMLELPFYILGVWWLIKTWGIQGAAIAWLLRIIVDTALFFYLADRLLQKKETVQRYFLTLAIGLIVLGLFIFQIYFKWYFVLLNIFSFIVISWFLLLTQQEKVFLKNPLKIFQ